MHSAISKWLAWGLIVPTVVVSSAVVAQDIKVETNRVRVITNSEGHTSVKTGNTHISLPRRRRWYPWRYWRSRNNCRYTHHHTSQVNRSRGEVYQSSSISSCR